MEQTPEGDAQLLLALSSPSSHLGLSCIALIFLRRLFPKETGPMIY